MVVARVTAKVRPTPPAGRPEVEIGSGVSPLLRVVARHADRWDLNVPATPKRVAAALRVTMIIQCRASGNK